MKATFLCILIVGFALIAAPVKAALIVFDPSNFGENALAAARELDQINNQLRQLENEAQMLINEARNLTTLPFNIVSRLRAALAETTRLIAIAKGISFELGPAQWQFARFYPATYDASFSGDMMSADALQRWIHSLQSLETTISMQAQSAQNLAIDEESLASLIDQSQGAVGILQATQATNQLLALHSRQSIQEQQLRLTQDRSAALEAARVVASEARAREVRRRFVGTATPYTAQWITFYGF
jgi:P-type conjugative transfer protein TrbJ